MINIQVVTNKPLKFVRPYGCLISLHHEEILLTFLQTPVKLILDPAIKFYSLEIHVEN